MTHHTTFALTAADAGSNKSGFSPKSKRFHMTPDFDLEVKNGLAKVN